MTSKNKKRGNLYALIILFSVSYSCLSFAEEEFTGEFILFPFIDAEFNSNLDPASARDNDEYDYGVDLFATFAYGKVRFLGEYLLTNDEHEFERLQLGWLINHNNTLWLGRFHNPLGFWNTNYHHGDYLETGISRPAIVEYEELGGILPMHLAGFLYEGLIEQGEHGIGFALAIAAGPEFTDELVPWDALKPGAGSQDLSATINLFYEPELYAPSRYGLFANYSEIPAKTTGFDEIRQLVTGVYANWESALWRVITAFYYVHNNVRGSPGLADGAFMHGYVQSEYEVTDKWTIYGRIERTAGDKNDAYLALLPGFIEDRLLGGVRFDFLNQHALKLEISDNQNDTDDFLQLMLQWSAVF